MEKTATVINVQGNGTWEGQYGLMWKFEVEMDNGDSGEYVSKYENQSKFIIGQEVTYDYTGGEYPKIKPVTAHKKPDGRYSDKNQQLIVRQSSLKEAINYHHLVANRGIVPSRGNITDTAQYFVDWVNQ